MSDVFKAIADPTRRSILLSLSQVPTHVNAIAEQFDMSRPAVSKHIKILEQCNLIRIEKDDTDSRQRLLYIQLEALEEVIQYLQQLEKFWRAKLDGLESFLNKES